VYKKYRLPPEFQDKIQSCLEKIQFSLKEPQKIARAILKLSDHYQQQKQVTPWNDPACVAASIAYYLPLNYVRNLKVFDEAARVGFPQDASCILDYGAGLGPSLLAASDTGFVAKRPYHVEDQSPQALVLLREFFSQSASQSPWTPFLASKTCGVFSYSINELPRLPDWFYKLKDIIIIEPSTSTRGRQLAELRSELLQKDYTIWAPCTHHEACPLLTHSKKDWCHDRVHWEQPEWFLQIEKYLPIKNNTLTFSYLLASRQAKTFNKKQGRIVGDELKEKGKTRWLYCHNSNRDFLSWLDKQGPAPDWHRGELLEIDQLEKKGNELRLTQKTQS
jgi:ribosomal protein RSM22 (predicted rRNA methylase)